MSKIGLLSAVLACLAAGTLVLANLIFDVDYWTGISTSSAPKVLQLIGFTDLRSIAIALTGAFTSILVFLPALTSIAKAQEENLQLTIIERQYVAQLGNVSVVLFLAFLGSAYSVFVLLAASYMLVAIQAGFLAVLLLLVFLRLRRLLVKSQASSNAFLNDAARQLECKMEEIVEDAKILAARSEEFEKHAKSVAKMYSRVPLAVSFSIPSTNQAAVVQDAGKRLKSIDLELAVKFLNEQLVDYDEAGDRLEKDEREDNFQINIRNPFQFQETGPSIVLLSLDKRRGIAAPVNLQELANSAGHFLQASSRFESSIQYQYEETRELIIQDFSESLIKDDVKKIQRYFELFSRIFNDSFNHHSDQKKAVVHSLEGEISRAIFSVEIASW